MIRVVIADDHAVARLGLRALLDSAADIELVGEACDGREALRQCADLRPDVLVIDLSMEGMDGLTAMRELVRRPDPPRILTLTMHDEGDYLIPALEAGASGYIVKSAASSTLLKAVRTVAAGETWVRPAAVTRTRAPIPSRLPLTASSSSPNQLLTFPPSLCNRVGASLRLTTRISVSPSLS